VVAQQNGTKIAVNGMTLKVTDKDGTKLKEIPLANLESLSLLGSVQMSASCFCAITPSCPPRWPRI
jgi:CRISPR-associated protein Cas1